MTSVAPGRAPGSQQSRFSGVGEQVDGSSGAWGHDSGGGGYGCVRAVEESDEAGWPGSSMWPWPVACCRCATGGGPRP